VGGTHNPEKITQIIFVLERDKDKSNKK